MGSKGLVISVRSATEADIPAMTTLCEQLGYPTTEACFSQRLVELKDIPSQKILVATNVENKVIGWIHGYIRKLMITDPHIEIGGLVIDEDQRGLGIGKTLVAEMTLLQ